MQPMTEAERLRIAERARRAREVLESEVMTEAWQALETTNINRMLSFGPEQDAERREMAMLINSMRAVKAQLAHFIAEADVMKRHPIRIS